LCWNRISAALLLVATATFAQEAPTVAELRAALKDVTTRSAALDEIARYWEGRDELEPDVRALIKSDWRAAWALGMKRDVTDESIAHLAKHPEHSAAKWALGRFGARAIRPVLDGLRDPERREDLCWALTHFGAAGRPAAFAIMDRAIHGDRAARDALHSMAPGGAPLLRDLIAADAKRDIELLCCVGSRAFPRITKYVGDQHDLVLDSLMHKPYGVEFFLDQPEKFGPYQTDHVLAGMNSAALIRALPHPRAFRALKLRGPWSRGAEPHLRRYLSTEHKPCAIEALSRIGAVQRETIEQLDRIMRDAETLPAQRDLAAYAVMRGMTELGYETLGPRVTDTSLSAEARIAMVYLLAQRAPDHLQPHLAKLGKDRSSRLPLIADLLAASWQPNETNVARCRKRFAMMGWRDQKFLLGFICELDADLGAVRARVQKLSQSKFPEVRIAAFVARNTYEKLPKADLDRVLEKAATANSARTEAILALGRFPLGHKPSLELLFRLSTTEHTSTHAWNALMLRRGAFTKEQLDRHDIAISIVYARGHRSKTELNTLLDYHAAYGEPDLPDHAGTWMRVRFAPYLLRSEHAESRSEAAWTLYSGGADEHLPALRRLLFDNDAEVRIAAWNAIEAIEARAMRQR